jgi:hypothetical protein
MLSIPRPSFTPPPVQRIGDLNHAVNRCLGRHVSLSVYAWLARRLISQTA